MSIRKLNVELSEEGINKAIKYLEDYKQLLIRKCERFVKELSKHGIETADQKISEATGETTDRSHTYIRDIHYENGNVTMDFTVTGNDIVFIEFGAGVYYNGNLGESAHEGEEFKKKYPEYRIGKYGTDGEKKYSLGAHDSWHYNHTVTHGTKATMPVYNAYLTMRDIDKIREVADKVFGKRG